jgi:predicted DCC family thiol-disulfide oxidoreductase YuxK
MRDANHRRVANPPPKPLMVFDGDCHFCRHWIERWRELTRGAVEYAPSQEVGARFPELSAAEFQNAVQFIEPDGTVSSGAAAVFRSLSYRRKAAWLARMYARVPLFARATEFAYAIVAKNRQLASAGTRLLWGDVRRPTYFTTRAVFLRALGVIYLIAFVSLWIQIDGLIGSKGVSPIANYLPAARDYLGASAPSALPSLVWLNSSDTFLHFLCGAGAVLSALLVTGFAPALALLLLFACYLSLTVAGQSFLSFQWDILLLETGFVAMFFAPWKWRIGGAQEPVSRVGLFLLKLLLFKLMFMSGVVKLTSGDPAWWDLTAMNFHYETQPLPTVLGWWAHQAPQWLQQFSTVFVLTVETVVPFLIWAPRRLRVTAAALLIGLQILILLTGNYAFFNLLTIALCLLLIDDRTWRRVGASSEVRFSLPVRAQRYAAIAFLIATLPFNGMLIYGGFKPDADWPRPLATAYRSIEPFRIVNGYGLFRVMTKTRPEIVIEGSADGIDWQPYEFRWKPGDLARAPRWVAPHQPRLDWQMWFAALGGLRSNQWISGLAIGLLRNEAAVVGLLARNPFAENPPRYVRAILYEYNFTTPAERRATGEWWKRRELREFFPSVSLNE